jgi:hypothetical protein
VFEEDREVVFSGIPEAVELRGCLKDADWFRRAALMDEALAAEEFVAVGDGGFERRHA